METLQINCIVTWGGCSEGGSRRILIELFLRSQVFCDVLLSCWLHVWWYFERTLCLHLQGSLKMKSPCHFLNVRFHSPNNTVSHSRRPDSWRRIIFVTAWECSILLHSWNMCIGSLKAVIIQPEENSNCYGENCMQLTRQSNYRQFVGATYISLLWESIT
jgi:hypothetical protein